MTKRLSVAPSETVATLSPGSVSMRCAEWCARLDAYQGERHAARELYSGGHWSVMKALAAKESSRNLQCFVISAGYGLVSIDAQLAPYAATFTAGHEDSLAVDADSRDASNVNTEWWKMLSEWHPSGITGPRSVLEAVKSSRKSIHIFALSPLYLNAISDDLSRARSELEHPEQLIIFSTGEKRKQHGELANNIIFAPASLQSHLGGAMVSLTVRLAAEVINAIPTEHLSFSEVRRFVADLQSRVEPRIIPSRQPATDAEVMAFIQQAAQSEENLSYTKLLRNFRDADRACEMRRFKRLFQKTVISQHGSRKSA